jgi:hypothetical protein
VTSSSGGNALKIAPHVTSGGTVLTFTSTISGINLFLPFIFISLSQNANFDLGTIMNVTISVNDATIASNTVRGGPKESFLVRSYRVTANTPNQKPAVFRNFDFLYPGRGEPGSIWISRLVSASINVLASDSSLNQEQGRRLLSLRGEVTQVIPWTSMSLSPFLGPEEAIYDIALGVDLRRTVVLDQNGYYGIPGSSVVIGDIRVLDADADDKNISATISIPSVLASSGWYISFLRLSPKLLKKTSSTSITIVGEAALVSSAFEQVMVHIGSATLAELNIEVIDAGAWVLPPNSNAIRSPRLSNQLKTVVFGEVSRRNIRPIPRILPETASLSISGIVKETILLQFSDIYDVDFGDTRKFIEVRITAESCASLGFSPLHESPTAGVYFLGVSNQHSTSDVHFEGTLESARLTLKTMVVQGRSVGSCKVHLFVNDRFAAKDGPKSNSVFMIVNVHETHQNQPPLIIGPESFAKLQIVTVKVPKQFAGIRIFDQDFHSNDDSAFSDASIYMSITAQGGAFTLMPHHQAVSTTSFSRKVRAPVILSGLPVNSQECKFIATYKAINNMLSSVVFTATFVGESRLTFSIGNSTRHVLRSFVILIKVYSLNAAPMLTTSLQSQEDIFVWKGNVKYQKRNRLSILSPYKVVPSDVAFDRSKDVAFYVISGPNHDGKYNIPFQIVESGCSLSGKIRVEMVVQNSNSSWNNFGRWMGWFQCRQGPTICSQQNPSLTLNSTVGLTFIAQPDYWHVGDGVNDYRMLFEGTLSDVQRAMRTVLFDGNMNGKYMLGSNIINVLIKDVEANFQYSEITDIFWAPNGIFQMSCGKSVDESKLMCTNSVYTHNSLCYGFHFLTAEQYTASARSDYISGSGIKPPLCTSGQTLTLFYRESFVAHPIFGTSINALAFVRQFDPESPMNICLGPQVSTALTFDARVLDEPINRAPSISIEKTNWFIQAGYQFPLAGFVVLDVDMFFEPLGDIALTFNATRGTFTFFNRTGLQFLLGTGVEDGVVTVSARVDRCLRALTEVQFRSANTIGSDTIVVTVNDQGTSGELGEKSSSVAINLDLRKGPYNLQPILNIPTPKQREFEIIIPHVIRDVFCDDPDWDRPRYDKLIPQSELELTISCQTCKFSIPYMRAEGGGGYGTRKMVDIPDQMTNMFKVRAFLPFLNKILKEIEIVMPVVTSDELRFVLSDLGNTGFSDDSGSDFAQETSDFLVIFGVPPAFKLGLRRVYMSLKGNDNNDCLSVQSSCLSLKRATEVSQTGDEVIVEAGIYTGKLNLNISIPAARFFIVGPVIDTSLALQNDEQYAIFDCEGNVSAYSFINMDSSPIFQNLVFRNCRDNSQNGGAMKISSSSPVFMNCSFQKCSSLTGSGGAAAINGISESLFQRCRFEGNSAFLGGGKCLMFFLKQFFIQTAALSITSGKVQIISCIFVGNFADIHGGGLFLSQGSALVRSTVFVMVREFCDYTHFCDYVLDRMAQTLMGGPLPSLQDSSSFNQATLRRMLQPIASRLFTMGEAKFCTLTATCRKIWSETLNQ